MAQEIEILTQNAYEPYVPHSKFQTVMIQCITSDGIDLPW